MKKLLALFAGLILMACVAAGVSIVPQGGNTGMVVGSTPDEYREWLKGDAQRWSQLIKTAHIKGD